MLHMNSATTAASLACGQNPIFAGRYRCHLALILQVITTNVVLKYRLCYAGQLARSLHSMARRFSVHVSLQLPILTTIYLFNPILRKAIQQHDSIQIDHVRLCLLSFYNILYSGYFPCLFSMDLI